MSMHTDRLIRRDFPEPYLRWNRCMTRQGVRELRRRARNPRVDLTVSNPTAVVPGTPPVVSLSAPVVGYESLETDRRALHGTGWR